MSLLAAITALTLAGHAALDELGELSLEELTQVTVLTPSKRAETLFETPASVYVITAADIRRTGVSSIPEALRLAPGVEVARRGSDSWTISIRGFNNDLSNKLLVLIDGRSVYSPLFAGVFWDVQQVMMEDIERIEVVSGPGGTIWGANAVNGVINIITRSASRTTGGLAVAAGDDPWTTGLRYGAAGTRAYLRYQQRDGGDRTHGQGGFRLDRTDGHTRYTLQGDVYRGGSDGVFRGNFTLGTLPVMSPGTQEVAGHNLLGRWTRTLSNGEFRIRAYYDHTRRDIPGTYNERRDTADVEVYHGFNAGGRHYLQWGAGARYTRDDIDNTSFAAFTPNRRSSSTLHLFAQDTITLKPRLNLTAGVKLEHNDFTGVEWQPNLRLAWMPDEDHAIWVAASEAVRIPARLETDLLLTAPLSLPGVMFPAYVQVMGDPAVRAEELTAFEAGYRFRVGAGWSLDATVYQHRYDNLIVTQATGTPFVVPGPPTYLLIPATLANGMEGEANGATLAVNFSPSSEWRLQAHYAYLDLDLRTRAGFDNNGPAVAGNSPEHQYALRAFWDMTPDISLYAGWRRVGALPAVGAPAYDATDLSVHWSPNGSFDLSLTASNLGGDHVEYGGFRIEPSVLGKAQWHF